jgi:hypothetical protein
MYHLSFKRKLWIALSLLFIFNSYSQQKADLNRKIDRNLVQSDFKLKANTLHPVAQKAIQNGIKPGTFQNVTYTYQKNVAKRPLQSFTTLPQKLKPDGKLQKSDFESLHLSKDSIYVVDHSDLVLQSEWINNDEIQIFKPTFEEVFMDFNLPLQTVPITSANTSYALEGSEVKDESNGTEYKSIMEFKDKEYEFEKEFEQGNKKEIIKFKIKINGSIAYNKPSVEAKYSKNDGYRLVFHADEIADLQVVADIALDFEVQIPVWEFKIPAGDIGEAKVGVYIVLGVGGTVQLIADIDQSLSIHSGVYGSTKYYFPTSVHTTNQFDSHCDLTYDFELTQLKAIGGIDCIANIKVKGYDLLKLRVRGALEVRFELEDSDKVYAIELGLRVLIDGKVKKINTKFTILDKYIEIWRKEEKNFDGYTLAIHEADAYHNRVFGSIYQTKDSLPYKGLLTLTVKHPNQTVHSYQGNTNDEGIFAMTEIDLKKGDLVSVSIADAHNPSESVAASIPFKEIKLLFADYYTNSLQGVISEKVNIFPKTVANQGNSNVQQLTQVGIQNTQLEQLKKQFTLPIKNFDFANRTVYEGDIEIVVRKSANTFNKEPEKQEKNKSKIADQLKGKQKIVVNPSVNKSAIDKDLKPLTKVKFKLLPFGGFEAMNVDLKPGDQVMVRINVDGFILQSDYMDAQGLILSPIIDVNFEGNAASRELKADDSFVVLTALHSEQIPQMQFRMLKGIDFRHTSSSGLEVVNHQSVDIFPNALHPIVYFDKIVANNLQQKTDPSLFHIGSWQVNNPYYNPGNILSQKSGGHLFEYLGMDYEGQWIGSKFYQDACVSCDTHPADKINHSDWNQTQTLEDSEHLEIPIDDMNDIPHLKIKMVQPKMQMKTQLKKL